jgi:hypothetical protein
VTGTWLGRYPDGPAPNAEDELANVALAGESGAVGTYLAFSFGHWLCVCGGDAWVRRVGDVEA